jgi:hypothetical protein
VRKAARLSEYLSDPFLKDFYNEQVRKLELAQEWYGMGEDDYLALWERVNWGLHGGANDEDNERFDAIISQVYQEIGRS